MAAGILAITSWESLMLESGRFESDKERDIICVRHRQHDFVRAGEANLTHIGS